MSFNINDMKGQLEFGGARPSLFSVVLTPGPGVGTAAQRKITFMAKATQLPQSTLGIIKVPYFGREIVVAGVEKFEDWTFTVIQDEDYIIRNSLETWINAVNGRESNLNTTGTSAPLNYKGIATVTLFSQTGQVQRAYEFRGVIPSNIGAVELGWEKGEEIMEYPVTFAYDAFQIVGGVTGNGGNGGRGLFGQDAVPTTGNF